MLRKKTIAALAAVALIFTVSGCGGNSNDKKSETTGNDVKITFLSTRTDIVDTTLRKFADNFEAENPGIKLEIEAVKDYNNIAKTRLAAGELTDVYRQIGGIKINDWEKYYLPLDDLSFADDMLFRDYNSYNGVLYSISTYANYSGILYNKKAFEKAGITELPKTLSELYEASEKLKAAGIVPTSAFYKDKWPTENWTTKLGPLMLPKADCFTEMVETDTPFAKDTAMYKAAGLYRSMYDKGYFEEDLMSTSWEGFKPAFAKGEFGWVLSETWLIPQIIENGASSDDIGFIPFPIDDSGELKTYLIPDDTLVVNKNSKHPEEAKKFLTYIMNGGYDEWLGLTGGFSTRKNYNGKASVQVEEFLKFNPAVIERVRENDDVLALINKAQIGWADLAIQSVSSPDLDSAMAVMNEKWSKARAK